MTTINAPAPWKAKRPNFIGNISIVASNGCEIAFVTTEAWGYGGPPLAETKTIAYLIAAAPELLAALQTVIDREDAESLFSIPVLRQIHAAIAKATGNQ